MLNSFLKKSPPPVGQRRIGGIGRLSFIGVALALCAYLEPPARADVAGTFKEAWKCAKSVPGSVQAMGQDLFAKGEAVASMSTSVGACVAQSGAQLETLGFVTATLGTIKLTNPELLPDGECKKRIHAQLARPFVLGISALLPEGNVKAELKKQASSDEAAAVLWSTLASAPPPFGTIPSELDCGCDLIDGAVTLADVSVVSQVIRPNPAKDSAKAAECTAHLRRIWEECARHYVGLVLDLQQPPLAHTRTCFDNRVLIEMPVSAKIEVPKDPIVAPKKSIFKLAP